ncbi:MAG: ribonuclease III domain-containing protein, partial [Clostridiales bacterium]
MFAKNQALENEHLKKYKELALDLGISAKGLPILKQALTHPAYFEGAKPADEGDNQRLEFLGDAVLDMLVGALLYKFYPDAHEGELTKMRAAVVCESYLAKKSEALGINNALLLGKGSEAGGDRSRPSVLADAFEAVLGAIYV